MPSEAASEAASPAQGTAGAATSAPADPDPAPPVPASFQALGTEPFWSASVADAKMTYATPETPDGITFPVTRRELAGAATYSGTIDGKPIELEVRAALCSDGMSDTVYPFAVVRRIGPDIQRGCAR